MIMIIIMMIMIIIIIMIIMTICNLQLHTLHSDNKSLLLHIAKHKVTTCFAMSHMGLLRAAQL